MLTKHFRLTRFRQLSAEGLKEIKDAINTPENLMIIPTSIHALVIYYSCS